VKRRPDSGDDRSVQAHPIAGHATISRMDDSPIELDTVDVPFVDVISARRDGEADFLWVHGIADAIMSARARGVDLVVPARMFAELRDDFPPDLPPYIKIR
jgi:hypothetical protein